MAAKVKYDYRDITWKTINQAAIKLERLHMLQKAVKALHAGQAIIVNTNGVSLDALRVNVLCAVAGCRPRVHSETAGPKTLKFWKE